MFLDCFLRGCHFVRDGGVLSPQERSNSTGNEEVAKNIDMESRIIALLRRQDKLLENTLCLASRILCGYQTV